MNQSLTPHFSRKVLFLSFIFLLANLGIYSLKNLAGQDAMLESLAPHLVSATIEDVEIKSPYDEDYRMAIKGQEIFSGTSVRTSEAEFAELVVGQNVIRLDESTEIELVENHFANGGAYLPDEPRLTLSLKKGSVWIDAFDFIEVRARRHTARLHHSVGILTYSEPINRVMVVTGDVDLSLLSEEGGKLSEFVVPLNSQVTFVDTQITRTYAALKPSKLRKELKMTPLSEEILEDDWVARSAYDFAQEKKAYANGLTPSALAYRIKSVFLKGLSYLTFLPEAKRNIVIREAETKLSYLLGGVQNNRDLKTAEKLIGEFNVLADSGKNDPLMRELTVKTLFAIEDASFGSPAYLLKEALMDRVEDEEGAYVYRIYLTDLRKALFQSNLNTAASVAGRWEERWGQGKVQEDMAEFDRQTQILNHTILSYVQQVPMAVLDVFDQAGERLMAVAEGDEEVRFEVTSSRLQVAASLVSAYRYTLAKNYLKNSYLSLNIEEKNPDLPATKIFLESGRLLAQRIEYAENVLHGAAQPIDETRFREYFQTKTRDEALSSDLREFFELGQEEVISAAQVEAPTAAQVADYKSNSVTDVLSGGVSFVGGFTLPDVVLLLKNSGQLSGTIPAPAVDPSGIDLLITDEEKIAAMEGQLVAQDVARKLAASELEALGLNIPDVQNNIKILDELNLDKFRILRALIPRAGEEEDVVIAFSYNLQTEQVTQVTSEEGVPLVEETDAENLVAEVLAKTEELERQIEVVADFNVFVKQNDLYILPDDIRYIEGGLLQVTDLEMLTLGLKVSGFYDPGTGRFVSVSHELLDAQDIDLKEYFEELAKTYLVIYLSGKGLSVGVDQIDTDYPFSRVEVRGVKLDAYTVSFEVSLENDRVKNVKVEGDDENFGEMSFDDLLLLPGILAPEAKN
jgi:hypothetical protein